MLGRLEMDVKSCIEAYIRLCTTVFSDEKLFFVNISSTIRARFKAELLEKAIKQIIAEQGLDNDELFQKPDSRCKVYSMI